MRGHKVWITAPVSKAPKVVLIAKQIISSKQAPTTNQKKEFCPFNRGEVIPSPRRIVHLHELTSVVMLSLLHPQHGQSRRRSCN